jgi:type II secretory pathway pseudopilin PulG
MVIVIIGILAAVAIPRFANLRRDAQQAACDGNLGALRGALSAYYAKGAISQAWDLANKRPEGFPRSIASANFRNCFLMANIIPECPIATSTVAYSAPYVSVTGVIPRHAHP